MRDTIDMAREAGDEEWNILIKQVMKHFPDEVDRLVDLVRADEREACAMVCEDTPWSNWFTADCAAAIRARGNT
jgi:hypothetical protein